MRFVAFLAHPIRLTPQEIEELRLRALEAIRVAIALVTEAPGYAGPKPEPAVVTGREDYQATFHACGTWEGWAVAVATGKAYRDGVLEDRYDAIIPAPGDSVGKGTARIVSEALRVGKPVYLLGENLTLLPVRHIVQVDPSDAQGGWLCET
jgi:hypothetical protein